MRANKNTKFETLGPDWDFLNSGGVWSSMRARTNFVSTPILRDKERGIMTRSHHTGIVESASCDQNQQEYTPQPFKKLHLRNWESQRGHFLTTLARVSLEYGSTHYQKMIGFLLEKALKFNEQQDNKKLFLKLRLSRQPTQIKKFETLGADWDFLNSGGVYTGDVLRRVGVG